MTLHDAIAKILKEKGRPMTISEITSELNETQYFKKKDNSEICDFQVHARIWNNSKMFRRDGDKISYI